MILIRDSNSCDFYKYGIISSGCRNNKWKARKFKMV